MIRYLSFLGSTTNNKQSQIMLHIDEGSKLLISSPQKAPKNASVLRHSEAGSVAHVDQQAG